MRIYMQLTKFCFQTSASYQYAEVLWVSDLYVPNIFNLITQMLLRVFPRASYQMRDTRAVMHAGIAN